MTATETNTPIYDELARLVLAGELSSQSGAHAHPVEPTPCTPVSWFGPTPDPVHARHSDTTVVKPGVVDGQERRAS